MEQIHNWRTWECTKTLACSLLECKIARWAPFGPNEVMDEQTSLFPLHAGGSYRGSIVQSNYSSCSSLLFFEVACFIKKKMLAFLISGQAIANVLCTSDSSKEECVSQVSLRTILFFLQAPATDVTGRVPWNGGLSREDKKLWWRKGRTCW